MGFNSEFKRVNTIWHTLFLTSSNAANVLTKYDSNINDELRLQLANHESTKFSLKEAFPQGFPELIFRLLNLK